MPLDELPPERDVQLFLDRLLDLIGVHPTPEVPEFLRQSSFMDKLARELATKAAEQAGETTVPRRPTTSADDDSV